jgi:hypothetical protein
LLGRVKLFEIARTSQTFSKFLDPSLIDSVECSELSPEGESFTGLESKRPSVSEPLSASLAFGFELDVAKNSPDMTS